MERTLLRFALVLLVATTAPACGDGAAGGASTGERSGATPPSDSKSTRPPPTNPAKVTPPPSPPSPPIDPATSAYLDGLSLLSAARYADAEKAFARAIESNSEKAEYFRARGVARTLAEKFPDALNDFSRAQNLKQERDWELAAWIALAGKMNNKIDGSYTPGSAPREEIEYAVALDAMSQRYWQSRYNGSYTDPVNRALVQTNEPYRGDFASIAERFAKRQLSAGGFDPSVLVARSRADAGGGRPLEALRSIDAAMANDAGNPDLLERRGEILLALGDLEGARRTYTDLLTRRASASAYIGRARAASGSGDANRAEKDLAHAAKLDARAATAARERMGPVIPPLMLDANALWSMLESQCRSNARESTIRETADAIVRATAATRIRYDERYQERRSQLEAELAAAPDDTGRMSALARFLHDDSGVLEERVGPRAEPRPYRTQSDADRKREVERAEELASAALARAPNDPAALTLTAHLLIDAARYDEAQAVVLKALARAENDPDLLETLASLLQIQAARRITAAGNLRQVKMWFETHFDEYPPAEYIYRRYPSPDELRRAAELEREAAQLSKMAEERIAKAAEGAGSTALGHYYRATLQRVRGDHAGARQSLTKAVTMQPDFQQAWFQLAGVLTQLREGDAAVEARARAYALAHTTASAELNALWYKIPRAQFKSARETASQGVAQDPADPRLPAYLAVIDRADGKADEALAHLRMARALCDANLALRGREFAPPNADTTRPERLPLGAENAAFPAAVRLRLASLLLDAGKAAEAAEEFERVEAALAAIPADDVKRTPPDALLPSANQPAGVVPLPESIDFQRIRADAGRRYARWADGRSPEEVAFAAETYRRMLVDYLMATESVDSMRAIADLGFAELLVRSGAFDEAAAAMKSTPAVPQDFWQEMRRTESEIRERRRGR